MAFSHRPVELYGIEFPHRPVELNGIEFQLQKSSLEKYVYLSLYIFIASLEERKMASHLIQPTICGNYLILFILEKVQKNILLNKY